jgi:hypothetical protein
MFSTLLLSALVLAGPAATPAPAAAKQDDPAIRIWLNNDGRFERGDQAKVQVKTREDGYLVVLNVDPDGRLRVLFPLEPGDNNQIRGGKTYQVVGRGGREGFTVSNRSGSGTVYAAVSQDPFRFDGYTVGDHWDLAALDDVRMSDKPENDLNDFARRLAGADFDYDVLQYDVFENVVYGSPNSVVYDDGYDYAYGGGYGGGYGYYGGTSLFIGLSFGHRHRFYDPFFYSPFYSSPFFYSPFYPAYYSPFYPAFYYPRPFRPFPVAFYPGRPYYGGYFATPWRQRLNDPLARGGFEWWRGRQATFGASATLASNNRSGFGRGTVAPARGATATPVRGTVATTDAAITRRRAPDMTPARIESTRPRGGVINPIETASGPVARRAVDRTESWAGRVADRSGGRAESPRRAGERSRDVTGMPEARPARSTVIQTRDRVEEVRTGERSGYEGPRVVAPRTYEARRAADDRPASRPNIESRRMDGSAPVRMERSEASPRVERSEPAPRMERSGSAPRAESRPSESRARGDGGGSRGGGDRGGGGGGGGGGGNRRR